MSEDTRNFCRKGGKTRLRFVDHPQRQKRRKVDQGHAPVQGHLSSFPNPRPQVDRLDVRVD